MEKSVDPISSSRFNGIVSTKSSTRHLLGFIHICRCSSDQDSPSPFGKDTYTFVSRESTLGFYPHGYKRSLYVYIHRHTRAISRELPSCIIKYDKTWPIPRNEPELEFSRATPRKIVVTLLTTRYRQVCSASYVCGYRDSKRSRLFALVVQARSNICI